MPRQPSQPKLPRASTSRPKSPIGKTNEKVVPETEQTVPLQPPKRSRKADAPMPEPALDHRRQIVGTDEPKRPPRR